MRDASLIRRVEILFEDDDLLVVNKPAGLLTIPGRQGGVALCEAVAHVTGRTHSLLLVHRLDRQTSGVLVLAKTVEAQRVLSRQFAKRQVAKDYLAIVRGRPDGKEGLIDAPLKPASSGGQRMVVSINKGRPAQTRWSLVEAWTGISLLRCRPLTGRQHQIRVHLKYIGLPLLVDALYARCDALYLSQIKADYRASSAHEERPLIERLTLHAERITFMRPSCNEQISIEAPLPKDFRATLNQLRKWVR